MYVFFYKMIGIQLYMFKSYNNSTLQNSVIRDIADIYRVSKKRLKCGSKRCFGIIINLLPPFHMCTVNQYDIWNGGSNGSKRERKHSLVFTGFI